MPRVYKIPREVAEAPPQRTLVDRTPSDLPCPPYSPGISRIDQPTRRTHGWFARIYPGGNREIRRFFADQKHGGWRAALDAAIVWRSQHHTIGSSAELQA